ncbi:hypothetical protein ASPZODRAFT_676248 [Penicilliopsis zonata CBS 506.65]|uniref:AB hydrolase-1 domain-containing protein n=1 Tax=Penicilliopsis zonata CBS 506.65 TaxID=1073090 RepID=A0A1L9SCZ8_9EURO|nr:hypothetical protein ASPZODRAFT_676248 [Penicilliopsis zonata CBS 506.65]OJJ45090.1 hypothetical protein ASPZODRAFT_676248 [Penicilliopsis zonata CBS 506.65]
MVSGLLYVTMQPQAGLPDAQFHDWYNTEHGPLRLRLPFITNGLRYRAVDLEDEDKKGKGLPEWVALYDVTDMDEMLRETYLALRGDGIKTQREKDTMAQIAVDRMLFDLVDDSRADDFRPVESLDDVAATGSVLVAVFTTVKPDAEDEYNRWYREEHCPMLSRVPGWRRTRRFLTAAVDPKAPRQFLALHEYSPQNGLGGPEHQAATSTAWCSRIEADAVVAKLRRVYKWYYTFGPAPRELASLASTSVAGPWSSNDGRTRTLPSTERPAVESFVTTADGVELAYRLEGATDPNAPLVVLSNSILVDYHIWDGFVDAFFARPENAKYRVLRYLTRGRTSNVGSQPVTIDVLAADIIALLDALRVPQAAALIGVSLGGVTVLNTALRYPARVATFISCDTNSSAPASNKKAWADRVAMAETEGARSADEPIVGQNLAEVTTRRWFVPATYETKPALAERVKQIVASNSLRGFSQAVNALCDYDVRAAMAEAVVPGLFVAGASDGILPQTMQQMAADLKGDAQLKLVEEAGHLPMVEQPQAFEAIVSEFINK